MTDCHTSQVNFLYEACAPFPFRTILPVPTVFSESYSLSLIPNHNLNPSVYFNLHTNWAFFRFEVVIPFSVERSLSSKCPLIMSSPFRFNVVDWFFPPSIVNEIDAFYPYFTESFAKIHDKKNAIEPSSNEGDI